MKKPRLMPSPSQRLPRYCARIQIATLAMCISTFAFADDSALSRSTLERLVDAANPYATAAYVYDSNLFRIADESPSTEGRSDQHTTVGAGFDSSLTVSRQKITLSGNIYRDKYDTYDYLDYTGGRANAIWNWSAGSIFTGTAGYEYRRSLRGFANQTQLEPVQDIRSEDRYLASTVIDLPRNLQATLRGSFSDISYSTTKTLELERLVGGAALNYVSRAGNIIGLNAEIINGDYDINPGRDFDEYTVGPTLEWQLTAGLRLSGRVGYTNRDITDPLESDYDDITGRIVLRKRAADRDQLTLVLWRELSNLGDEIADFALIHGVSIEPRWQLSEVLGLRMFLSYEDRDFQGVGPDADRQDDVYTGGVFADWAITRNFTVSLGFNAQDRSSTRAFEDYDVHDIQLQITGRL